MKKMKSSRVFNRHCRSAASGEGIDSLGKLSESLGMDDLASSTPFSARERHLSCLRNAQTSVNATDRFMKTGAGEFLVEDLRCASHVERDYRRGWGRRVTGRNLFFLLYRKIDTFDKVVTS